MSASQSTQSPKAPVVVSSSTSNRFDDAAATSAARQQLDDGFVLGYDGTIGHNRRTAEVLADMGGVEGIIRLTTAFYTKFHNDRHIRQFLGGLQQPLEVHAGRLGKYIAEMMGATGGPWTQDCRTRERKTIELANGRTAVASDRQSAHYCAWNSKDRPAEKVGRRFKLDDCRVWMRLMFWSAREVFGANSVAFAYLVKFIAYFIAIYETTARSFTLAEARWSADPRNIEQYIKNGYMMHDVVDVPLSVARATLPRSEWDLDDWLFREGSPSALEMM